MMLRRNQEVKCVVLRTGLSWFQWEWKDFCKDTNATRASPSQHGTFGACKTGYGEGVREHSQLSPEPSLVSRVLVVESAKPKKMAHLCQLGPTFEHLSAVESSD